MKIFWSWQSDLPGDISRHFVREALELAVASLNEDLAIEEPEREVTLDHDRKDVPGSPDLANVILEKINGSDVFVADVTPVGTTLNDPPKKLMNPNVAIELGYALHSPTDRRMIMVMNAAYGTLTDLPFDLRHKAGPICYTLPPGTQKEQIQKVKKRLAGEFKVALRAILPTLGTGAAAFEAVPSRPSDPSRYYDSCEVLVSRDGWKGFVAETPTVYLRITPTKKTAHLKRAEAYHLIRDGSNYLEPFYRTPRGTGFEPNRFGAIAFVANDARGEILCAAQLFLNREIWGFNTISLSPELAKSRGKPLGIPSLTVEETFAAFLPAYSRFMNDKLGVAPPYRIEGGAFGVKDYLILMPPGYPDDEWGPIYEDHVHWSGILPTCDARDMDAVLLKIFEAFFDAAACPRPAGLHSFPGDKPGSLPRR
jgi:hypothetical protein